MLDFKTTVNKALRETTVTASDKQGRFLACETWSGTGKRVSDALREHVGRSAEQLMRRENIAAAGSATEARLVGQRL